MTCDIPRVCVTCAHFYFDGATSGYSAVTPGSNMSLGCHKDIWKLEIYNDTTESYRAKILTALTCEHYEVADV